MLVNKKEAFVARYNGIEVEVAEGARLDVRDFNILNAEAKNVERQMLKKHPGRFEQVATVDDAKIANQYQGKIAELSQENIALKKEIEKLKDANEKFSKKNASQAEEINGFGTIETGLKNQITALKGQIKELEEEHKAHIARLTGGKR